VEEFGASRGREGFEASGWRFHGAFLGEVERSFRNLSRSASSLA
jgi:hypothetical protein